MSSASTKTNRKRNRSSSRELNVSETANKLKIDYEFLLKEHPKDEWVYEKWFIGQDNNGLPKKVTETVRKRTVERAGVDRGKNKIKEVKTISTILSPRNLVRKIQNVDNSDKFVRISQAPDRIVWKNYETGFFTSIAKNRVSASKPRYDISLTGKVRRNPSSSSIKSKGTSEKEKAVGKGECPLCMKSSEKPLHRRCSACKNWKVCSSCRQTEFTLTNAGQWRGCPTCRGTPLQHETRTDTGFISDSNNKARRSWQKTEWDLANIDGRLEINTTGVSRIGSGSSEKRWRQITYEFEKEDVIKNGVRIDQNPTMVTWAARRGNGKFVSISRKVTDGDDLSYGGVHHVLELKSRPVKQTASKSRSRSRSRSGSAASAAAAASAASQRKRRRRSNSKNI